MIASIIRWSVGNRFFVLLATFLLVGIGLYSVNKTPIDALPDLSDVQVIIKTSYPGQAPQVVEDQVTYPMTTAMLSVPGAVTVRGYSFFVTSTCKLIPSLSNEKSTLSDAMKSIVISGHSHSGIAS